MRIEDFALEVFIVGGEGRLGRVVQTGEGCWRQVCGCAEDEGPQGEIVEHLATVSPHVGAAVFTYTFIVEAVHGRDLSRLVVPSDEGDPVRIADLEAEEQEEGLERVEASVDEIAHEKVVCVRKVAADAKEFHEIVELAVDVATYRDRSVDRDHVALFDEQFSRLVAELSDLRLRNRSAGTELSYGSKK